MHDGGPDERGVRAAGLAERQRLRLTEQHPVDHHAGVGVDGFLQARDGAVAALVVGVGAEVVVVVRRVDTPPGEERREQQHEQRGASGQHRAASRRFGDARDKRRQRHGQRMRALAIVAQHDGADQRQRYRRRFPDVAGVEHVVHGETEQRAAAGDRHEPLPQVALAPRLEQREERCQRQASEREQPEHARIDGNLQESVVGVLCVYQELAAVHGVQQAEDVRPGARQRIVAEHVERGGPRVLSRRE